MAGSLPQQSEPESDYSRICRRASELCLPLHALWEVTHRCPLRCRHCYLSGKGEEEGEELSTAEARDLLRQMARLGVLFLVFTGGEPLFRDDLFEILDEACALGFAWQLFTSGTLMTPEGARQLAKRRPLEVHISLHGLEDTHERLTRVPGSFCRALGAIDLLTGLGVRVVAKMNVTPPGLQDLAALRELCSRRGVELRDYSRMFPDLEGKPVDEALCLSERELADYFLECESMLPPSLRRLRPLAEGEPLCSAGRSAFAVSPRGDVRACLAFRQVCGNIRETPLGEIWRAEAMVAVRQLTAGGRAACRDCPQADFCSYCPALAEAETGDPLGAPLSLCREARLRQSLAHAEPAPRRP